MEVWLTVIVLVCILLATYLFYRGSKTWQPRPPPSAVAVQRARAKMNALMDKGVAEAHDLPATQPHPPPAEDPKTVADAQRFFHDNIFAFFASMMCGILSNVYIPSICRALEATGRSSTAEDAFRRYLGTIDHVIEWYKSPADKKESLVYVRRMHHWANKKTVEKSGQSMSQLDMVVAQWSFVGPMFAFPERIGLAHAKDEELRALAHQMYWIGDVIGVRPEHNLCAGSLDEVRAYCAMVCEDIIIPCLEKPSAFEENMAEYLLQGCSMINPFIDGQAFRPFMYRRYGVPSWPERADKDIRAVSSRVLFVLACWLFEEVMRWPVTSAALRPLLNFLMRANISSAHTMSRAIVREHRRRLTNERAESSSTVATVISSALMGLSFSTFGLAHYICSASMESIYSMFVDRRKVSRKEKLGSFSSAPK